MRRSSLPTLAMLFLMVAAGLVGCSARQAHDEAVDNANKRWYELKSKIAMEMAEDQFNSGQLGLAQKTIEEAMINDMENPGLWVMGGRIALEESKLESAYQRFAKAIELGEDLEGYDRQFKAEPYYYQGIINQRWQRYEAAKDGYTLAYERDPENVSYFLARIEMMVQLDQLNEATTELESKSGYFDQNATVRALLGHVFRKQGDDAKAAMWFKQASMLAPEDMKLREEVVRAQAKIGRHQEAANGLSSLIKTEYGEARPDLYRLYAECLEKLGKLREARDVYQDLTQMNRTSVQDWSKLGELAYRVGDEAVALSAANRLINLSPDNYRGYLMAGMVWNKRDRLDRALSMFDRAAELAPENTTPLILRGMALQKNDRPGAAADAYKQALEINPEDRRAKQLLSSVTEGLR